MAAQSSSVQAEARPWVIVLLLPQAQHRELVRFRNRQDAEDHLRALRRFMPKTQFELVFEMPTEAPEDIVNEVNG